MPMVDSLVLLRQARHDRRKRRVELTSKSESLLPRARQLWRRAENRFENIFGKDPAAELRAVLLSMANSRELDSQPLG
jgi:DNA-binding MarR family transcriptional regulator